MDIRFLFFITAMLLTIIGSASGRCEGAGFVCIVRQSANASAFDPSGNFVFVGRPPRGFANVKWVYLNTTEIDTKDYTTRRPITPQGALWAGRELKMTRVAVEGDALSFTAAAARGVSYEFAGRFLERGVYSEKFERDGESKRPVLEGTLSKLQHGRKVAESVVKFNWVLGG